jgi:hypothetical protein
VIKIRYTWARKARAQNRKKRFSILFGARVFASKKRIRVVLFETNQ